MICEIIGGLLSNSLAILCDAAHMMSDVAGFGISMLSIWVGQKSANNRQTYGWHRAEVLGALASILIIWVMVVWLVIEATDRIAHPNYEIKADIMMVTAFISLACNLFNLAILGYFPLPCGLKPLGQEYGGVEDDNDHDEEKDDDYHSYDKGHDSDIISEEGN